ncbi:Triostin synthetase I [Pirellula sp. SH-Sr6A]|uniref:AMP-binding protein n=1 Tax=Pirellula sp. SH-Sr6A TaxID=1632865 RepID=UPI00078E066D|nr:AMP-binding protein [Pirellula sp. SH-Sr6A]AMV31850.1 Triostin synthetase I [Pirellula sp. SH-Sr6A]
MRKCNADRPFFVDHPILAEQSAPTIWTYRDLLSDLAALSRGETSVLGGVDGPVEGRSGNGESKDHRSENGYYLLLGVIARILRDRDCDLSTSAGVELLSNPPSWSGLTQSSDADRSDMAFLLPDGTFDGEALSSRVLASKSHIVLSTSGTTGDPKPIRQSIGNLARAVQISPKHGNDVWGLAYQPTKIAGIQVLLQALCNGNTLVNLFGLPVPTAREWIRRFQVSHLSATPTYFRLLAADTEAYPLVQAVTVGGEVADASIRARLGQLFPNARFRNVYASSELGTLFHSHGDSFLVPDSVRNSIRIQEQRLWVHQDLVAENLRSQCVDGFWDTGDSVEVLGDEPLQIRITGRRSDWINVGGMKVNPHEVETALCSLPGVLDARVFGVPNSVTGSLVAAELSIEPSSSLRVADVRQLLQGILPTHAIPRVISFREGLVISPTGKKERRS